MIDFLSKWIEGIAIAVIIASIFEMILPKSNLKKYIKIILGIYIVFTIISPFVDNDIIYSQNISEIIKEYTKDIEVSSSDVNKANDLTEIYIDTFEKEITSTVENQGYNVKECTVEGVFDSNNHDDMGINKIYILVTSKNNNYNKEKDTNMIITNIEKVEINVNKKIETKEENESISTEDIKELKTYLSKYYEIDKNIFEIQIG